MGGVMQWFIRRDGNPSGPVTFSDLSERARDGRLQRGDLVWCEGMDKWQVAEQIPGLWFPPKVPPVTTSSKPQKRAGPLGMTLMIIGGVLSLGLIPPFVKETFQYLKNNRSLHKYVEQAAQTYNARAPIDIGNGATVDQAWASGKTLTLKARIPVDIARFRAGELPVRKARASAAARTRDCADMRSLFYRGLRLHYYYVDVNNVPLHDVDIDWDACQGQYQKSPPPVSASAPQETEDPLSFLDDPPK